jgi:PHS family inorganic phosphate transporter-like MFS transporter
LRRYAFTFFFANWGPNSTTFVYPAELFPASVRSTAHGISAATGKAGAIIGSIGFLYASKDPVLDKVTYGGVGVGLQKALGIMAAVNFCGLLCTFLLPDIPLNTSLEDVSGELDTEEKLSA